VKQRPLYKPKELPSWRAGQETARGRCGSVRPEVGDDRRPPPVGDRGEGARDAGLRWAAAGLSGRATRKLSRDSREQG
jgi:hypothetical protein